MSTLSHLNTTGAKPGAGFSAKGIGGFTGKLQSAIKSNFHGLGALKDKDTTVAALTKNVITKQSQIRGGGLEQHQAHAILHKIQSAAYAKGEHLSSTQKDALKKIVHHLAKPVIQRDNQDTAKRGITSLANASNNKGSVKQIGDTTRMVHQGQTIRASGGIASSTRRNQMANNLGGINKPSNSVKPPSIKLSI